MTDFNLQRTLCIVGRAFVLVALVAAPAWAQRELKVIPDPDPELERQTFELAEGLEVNLYAADPLLAKPIQINFDAQGRLWVASSEVYPQVKPGQVANDKILVLEDEDRDGRADKTSVFADGLLIPTGLEPGDGGVYVANSTELLHFKDTNGDGRADTRRVMLSGFGTEDTHHIIHTFRWGHDGMLYFNQSIYIHSHIETPHGPRRLNSGGVWQFRPETMQLEVFARGLCNPWGHIFDRWGQSFATDGAGGEGINYIFPGATLFTYAGATKVLRGLNPGSPKHCGLEVISGRHFPDDWQGSLVTSDFRAHRVCRFVVTEAGAGYSSRQQTEIIKSKHAAFRPIDAKIGPDGALYIADWYNPIIQHGEVDFRDERRDHTHGRIWRVTVKDRPLVERPQIVGAPIEQLLEMLRAPEDFTRLHAKLELKSRGQAAVLPKLADWTTALDPADPRFEHLRLEALWTCQALNYVQPLLLNVLLQSEEHHARAAATRVLRAWHRQVPQTMDLLAQLVADAHPQVRLEAIRALAELPTLAAAELALSALDKEQDRFIDHALWLTVRDLQPAWLPALEKGEAKFADNPTHLLYVLDATRSPRVVPAVMKLLKAGKLPAERQESTLALIAELGGPDELRVVFDAALDTQLPAATRGAVMRALNQATRVRKARPSGDLTVVAQLFEDADEALRLAGVEAAGLWRLEPLRDPLQAIVANQGAGDAVRKAALDSLATLGAASLPSLTALCQKGQPAATRAMALEALARLDIKAAAGQLIALMQDEPAFDPTASVAVLVGRKDGATALAEAAAGQKLPIDAAKLAVRAVRASGRELPELAAALNSAGGISGQPAALTSEEMSAMVADVLQTGNAERGEAIYRRNDQNCFKCHAIAGSGGRVGPDLVSIGASAQVDYLIESILQPSAKIKENYHSLTVVADGRVTSGVKVRETEKELVLRDVEDREVSVPIDAIEDRKEAGSLMPVGLVDTLTRAELVDLVRFLSELGKVGPYSVGNARVVRRWQALLDGKAAELVVDGKGDALFHDDAAGNWTSAYAKVSGHLPLEEAPGLEKKSTQRVLRCQLEAAAGGPVDLVVSGPVEKAWLDGTALAVGERITVDVPTGVHTVALVLKDKAAGEIRLELADVADSPAQVQVVGGK